MELTTEEELRQAIDHYENNCLDLAKLFISLQKQTEKNQKRLDSLSNPKDLNIDLYLRNNIKDLNLIKFLFYRKFGGCLQKEFENFDEETRSRLLAIPEIGNPKDSDGYKSEKFLFEETKIGRNTLPSYLFRLHQYKNGETYEWIQDLKDSFDKSPERNLVENSFLELILVRDISILILLEIPEFSSHIHEKYIPFLKQNKQFDVLKRFLNLPFVSDFFEVQKPIDSKGDPIQEKKLLVTPQPRSTIELVQQHLYKKGQKGDDEDDDEDDEEDEKPEVTVEPLKAGRNTKKKKRIQKTKKVGNKKKSTRLKKKVRK